MAQLKDLIVNGPSRFIGDVYATTFTGNLEGNASTATSATTAAALTGKTLVTASSVTTSNWSTYADNHIPTMSFIAYWNGAYSGTSSNLTYCKQGTIIGSNNIGSQSVKYATTSGSCSGNAASSIQSLLLSSTSDAKEALGVYFHRDFNVTSLVGNTEGNGAWGHPSDSQDARYGNASILRIGWDSKYYTDIFTGPNIASGKYGLQWRQIVNGTANDWKMLLDSSNYNYYALPLSGGTITGALTINTYIDSSFILDEPTGEKYHKISFRASGEEYAYLLSDNHGSENKLVFNGSTILHSGNFNTYAPKLDGTGASGTWNININGCAGALCKYINITDLNIPSWGLANGYSINYNTCRATVSNAPSTINNANLIMNIQNGNHGSSGQYGWQVGFFNNLNSPYVRRWSAGSVGAWYKLLHSGNYNEFAPSLTGTGATGTWGISISGNAATATNADKLDGLHESDFSRHITGTTRTTGTKYFKLGNLPKSSDSTWDSFLIQGEIGGWASLQKTVLNVCVGRRNGVAFCGYTQGLWNRNLGIDIGVNDAGEIVLIVTGQYCAWTLDLHTIQGTISYTGTTFTPTDTNFVLLSASNNVSKSLADGTVEKATKLQNSRTIWGQSFNGTGDVNGNLSLGTAYLMVSDSKSSYNALLLNEYGLYLGFGTAQTYNTTLWGKNISLGSGVNGQVRLYIQNDGNVGIGTTSPAYKLDVNGEIHTLGLRTNYIELSAETPFIDFHYNNSTADFTSRIIEGLSGQLTVTGKLRVGLNYTTSTDYKLHVAGTAYASGGLVSDGPVKVNESFVVDGTNGSWYGKLNIADEVYILGEDTNINFIESLNIKQHNTTNNTETSIVSIDNSGNITLNVMNNNGGSYEISTRSGALGIGIPSNDPNIVNTPSFLMSDRGYIYLNASLPSSPNYPLVVNGTIQCTTLKQTSDIKYKSNIKQIEYEEALKIIENLNPVTWDWNENTVETGSSSGFVAQEAEEFIPNAISRDNENNLSLDYTQLHSYEIRVIQEQQKEIIKLKEKLKILENLIS